MGGRASRRLAAHQGQARCGWEEFAPKADAILFVAPKLKFLGVDLMPGRSPAQGTCLLADGPQAAKALKRAQDALLGTLMVPV